jgi:signal transduction histidine kinase
MPVGKSVRILHMEDNPGDAQLVRRQLEAAGHVVSIAPSGEAGLAMCRDSRYDIALVDYLLPGQTGLEVIQALASQQPSLPTVMVTGSGSEHLAVEALRQGASDYIIKDLEGTYVELLPAVLERVLQRCALEEEKRRAEEALRQRTVELQASNEELDAFAHTVAHDLKDPLAAVIGYAETMLQHLAALSAEETAEYLRTISQEGRRMHRIVDELLLLAGVRTHGQVIVGPLDMGRIVGESLQRLAYLIESSQGEVTVPREWPVASGYAPWVEEVWANYLSNGLKYGGRPPRLELGAEVRSERTVRFWVRDNGPGIFPEEQARLFLPFTRLGQIRAKGQGLGLSIVRTIVERLDGQVGVESEIGAGSVFWFSLSLWEPHAAQMGQG